LLKAIDATEVRQLHFTHFGFLQGKFPTEEISGVLRAILGWAPRHLVRLIFDIDSRSIAQLYGLMRPPEHAS